MDTSEETAEKEKRAGGAVRFSMEDVKSKDTGSYSGCSEESSEVFGAKTDIFSEDEPAFTERIRFLSGLVDIVLTCTSTCRCLRNRRKRVYLYSDQITIGEEKATVLFVR